MVVNGQHQEYCKSILRIVGNLYVTSYDPSTSMTRRNMTEPDSTNSPSPAPWLTRHLHCSVAYMTSTATNWLDIREIVYSFVRKLKRSKQHTHHTPQHRRVIALLEETEISEQIYYSTSDGSDEVWELVSNRLSLSPNIRECYQSAKEQ